MIFFYTMVFYVVRLIVDEKGFNISNKLGGTTVVLFFLLFISLDATDCSRCFRLFIFGFGFPSMVSVLYLASFVWADGECCNAIYLCPVLVHLSPMDLIASSFSLFPCVFSRSDPGFPSSYNQWHRGRDHQERPLHNCVLEHDLDIAACTHLCVERQRTREGQYAPKNPLQGGHRAGFDGGGDR